MGDLHVRVSLDPDSVTRDEEALLRKLAEREAPGSREEGFWTRMKEARAPSAGPFPTGELAFPPRRARPRAEALAALFAASAQSARGRRGLLTHFRRSRCLAVATAVRETTAHPAPASRSVAQLTPTGPGVEGPSLVQTVGDLRIAPPGARRLDPAHLVVDPGMAFGTGDHPTTRSSFGSCSASSFATRRSRSRAGAVLAIAAAKLGAGSPLCSSIPCDRQATGNVGKRRRDVVHVIEGTRCCCYRSSLRSTSSSLEHRVERSPRSPAEIARAVSPGGRAVLAGFSSKRDDARSGRTG